ncbi:MAG: hypothetical protein L0L05_10640, partial [Yaniella sp.]|nr:hypothetical protein [Yaniella sp.]
PDPNWGPPDDDEWMPNEDPWNPQPPENSATPQPPQQAEPAETQQSAPQQPAPVEEPSSAEPEIATGPDPVASDGYAGFIPRNEQAEEPVIPAFAKSEAELRQEFQRRFGDVIPGSSGKKPQQDSPKPASGSRFADMVAQYGGQPQSGSESETAPQEEKTSDDDDDDYASEDDEIIEDSGLAGRSVVENVLNGRLVEERNADGSPKL